MTKHLKREQGVNLGNPFERHHFIALLTAKERSVIQEVAAKHTPVALNNIIHSLGHGERTFTVRVPGQKRGWGSDCERRGNTLEGYNDFSLKSKARIWPCLSYMCHIRSIAGGWGGVRFQALLVLAHPREGEPREEVFGRGHQQLLQVVRTLCSPTQGSAKSQN